MLDDSDTPDEETPVAVVVVSSEEETTPDALTGVLARLDALELRVEGLESEQFAETADEDDSGDNATDVDGNGIERDADEETRSEAKPENRHWFFGRRKWNS